MNSKKILIKNITYDAWISEDEGFLTRMSCKNRTIMFRENPLFNENQIFHMIRGIEKNAREEVRIKYEN